MKLSKSDVVRLATGGPWMTVTRVLRDERVECVWFDGEQFQKEEFDIAVLSRPA
jgi:uncharacterized protein YodC (DUF2158 family)